MSKKARIRLKTKPRKPKKQRIYDEVELYEGQKLAEVVEELGVPLDQISIKVEYGYGDDPRRTYLRVDRMQTDEEYEEDLKRYRKRLAKYEEWYKENEEAILAEVERRKEEAEERKRRVLEQERGRLEKELKKLNRHLQK
jgi:uncharacterized FlaG/YvyC family protein